LSHFSLLVVGENVDEKLAPFQEGSETFIEPVDITDEVASDIAESISGGKTLAEALEYWGWDDKVVACKGDHGSDYLVLDGDTVVEAVQFRNPNPKWDWYEIGGRWPGLLLLKDGNRADSARKCDIDVEGMRAAARDSAAKQYDTVMSVVAGRTWKGLEQLRAEHGGDVDAARTAYWAQDVPSNEEIRTICGYVGCDEYLVSREEYIRSAAARAVGTYAVLKDGVWYENGSSAWSAGTNAAWADECAALFDSIPDGELVTVVDCHI